MKMTDLPCAVRLADDREQLLRLLRRQHGCRLVEHEDVGAAVERLQDLDPLLLPDRDVLDAGVRIDDEPEPLRDLPHSVLGAPSSRQDRPMGRLDGEDDVLGHGHHGDEHEMLVHHADAAVDRGPRRAQLDRLALDHDLALVRPVQAVEHIHQRRLAGPVLAEQRVHFTFAQVDADVVVGHDPGKPLRHMTHLEDGRAVGHRETILRVRSDRRPWNEEGGHVARPPRSIVLLVAAYFLGALILPEASSFETAVSLAMILARFGALMLTLPKPTPPFFTV